MAMGPRGRHPDFVIVHPSNGLLVLEVKDWRLDRIAGANKSNVEIISNVAGIVGLPIEVFVTDNGTTVKVEDTDWAAIELRPRREITIALGTPLEEIPNFTWDE